VLAGAFFRAQILQHEKYQLRAESNRLRPVPLPPPRGAILDRKGEVIAENLPGYTVKLIATNPDSLRSVLLRLATVVPLDSAGISDIVRRWRGARYQPAVVFGEASFETASVSRSTARCSRDWCCSRSRGGSTRRARRWRTWWATCRK
jgi:penicillin-binding protein 2